MLRWLYHGRSRAEAWESAREAADAYSPRAAHGDGAGFIHASYRDVILESAQLYLRDVARVIVRIDPRRLGATVRVAQTPRGAMPHIHGSVPRDAIAEVYEEAAFCAVAISRATRTP